MAPQFPINRLTRRILPLAVALALSACASVDSQNVGGTRVFGVDYEVAKTFANARSCCASTAEFKYVPLTLPASVVTHIQGSSPAFEFTTGKSYFLAYQLPTSPAGLQLTISSFFASHVFFPNFLFLDSSFKPVRQIGLPDTHYVPPSMWVRGHYELTATVNPDDPARYLVVLTTDADLHRRHDESDSHTMIAAGGIFVPVATGAFANAHGPTGKIKLVVQPLAK